MFHFWFWILYQNYILEILDQKCILDQFGSKLHFGSEMDFVLKLHFGDFGSEMDFGSKLPFVDFGSEIHFGSI